ncbi:MAG TPA: hypothetical protein VFY71_05005 [Planctomycetota bacterium]|nr:hypothetical protein [Planctomycetota bacterium]
MNGVTAASVEQGLLASVTLTGTPGKSAWLLLDVSPGPVTAFAHLLPLGFTPALVIVPLGVVPAGGTIQLGATIPFDTTITGVTVYMVGTVATGAKPSLYDWSNGASLKIVDRNQQLAGNPLATYPDFEYVRAFNANAPVTVTVDPALHPEVAGDTADVYVVAKKTRAQWLFDGTLVDVNGGPRTVVLSGANLQANEVVVANANQLSADAGFGLGVGYDVVVDLDQNGQWDHADLIDGFSDEAGLYRVHDTTLQGPLPVTEAIYSGGTWLGQDLYYPTNIASLPGKRPLVMVSHGNGHNYTWYDHIGYQLASYGFIVMSHTNNTVPGIEACSETTLTNTDYLLGNLATIEGGVLLGHLDSHRIMWIGHSRGGEGIARAVDKLIDGLYLSPNFTVADIKLLSSMAPTDFLLTASANPHGVPYHLWVGGADNDVSGCPVSDVTQSYHLLDRADGWRMATGLYGVGHGDFHDSTGSVASGPCLVGKPDTHTIMRGYFVPLAEVFLENNIPGKDFLWRQWEHFRPIGSPDGNPCVVVNLQYQPTTLLPGNFVLDDFQANPSTSVSSSGGAVSGTVTFIAEGRMDDSNSNFTTATGTWNGFTEAAASDTTKGVAFEYNGSSDVYLEFDMPTGTKDVSNFPYFQFRACQVTRDALTIAALQDTTFAVELRDAAGHSSTVDIGAWGGGIEEPYQRTNCGIGAGWGNEFETIRIRLNDLIHGSSGLDLTHLAAMTFRFGPSFSSPAMGALGMDDLQFTGE